MQTFSRKPLDVLYTTFDYSSVKQVLDHAAADGCKFISVTISKNKCGQFFASVLMECEVLPKPKTGKFLGLDIDIKPFLKGTNGFIRHSAPYF